MDTARKAGYGVGDTVTLVTPGDPPTLKAKVSGLVEFGSGGLNGATLTLFDVRVLQKQFFGGRDVYSSISLDAAPGVSQVQLRDAAQKVLPQDVVARTGDELVKKNKAQLDEILGFLNTFLLVFAGRLAGGRHVPDRQHLLDPGRAAQPRARAAAGARRLAPPGEPSRCSSRRSRSASSARRSGSASATCSPAGCSCCSARSAST